MRIALARAVWTLHIVVLLFVATAWTLPWSWALWGGVLLYPLVQINWWLFGNRCGLTVLEERLRRSGGGAPAREGAGEEPLHFVADLASRILRRPVSRLWGDLVSYAFVWGGFALAVTRLYARSAFWTG